MRGNIGIRIFVAAAIIGVTYLGMYVIEAGIQVKSEMPSWDIRDLPLQLGEWKGKETKLDEQLNLATGAQAIVNRTYTNDSGTTVSLHFAAFTDPEVGIWHNPFSCYTSAGWVVQDKYFEQLPGVQDEKGKVSFSTWKKGGDRVFVLYWFQLGEHRLYDRWDLGTSIRWQMRGRKVWPALLKILISTSANRNTAETRSQVIEFADLVYGWINQASHHNQ